MRYCPVDASHVWPVEATSPSRCVQVGFTVSFMSEKSSNTAFAVFGPAARKTAATSGITKSAMCLISEPPRTSRDGNRKVDVSYVQSGGPGDVRKGRVPANFSLGTSSDFVQL